MSGVSVGGAFVQKAVRVTRNVVLSGMMALAAFAVTSSIPFFGGSQAYAQEAQASTLPSYFKTPADFEAYKTKMRNVIKVASTHPDDIPELNKARIIRFIEALKDYNKNPTFQETLANVSEETLLNYAHFVNNTDKTPNKLYVVESYDEDAFLTLMMVRSIVPKSTDITYKGDYAAKRNTSSLISRGRVAVAGAEVR